MTCYSIAEQAVEILISEDQDLQLREQASNVPECLRSPEEPTWVFVGNYAMPNSEHLIPLRT